MIKDPNKVRLRRQLIKEIIDTPDAAIERIDMLLVSLRNSRKTDERFKIAAEMLHLSEQTILNDYLS